MRKLKPIETSDITTIMKFDRYRLNQVERLAARKHIGLYDAMDMVMASGLRELRRQVDTKHYNLKWPAILISVAIYWIVVFIKIFS